MTEKEIFKKAIEIAEGNGYKVHLELLPELPQNPTCAENLKYQLLWEKRYEVIFSHDFAKAFWGYEKISLQIGNNKPIEGIDWMFVWEYHLQTMVLYTYPLEQLENFL